MSNFCLILCFAALLVHTISECWIIIEFIKDILTDWSNAVGERSDHELKAHFAKTVQLHWTVKELSKNNLVLQFLRLNFESVAQEFFFDFIGVQVDQRIQCDL